MTPRENATEEILYFIERTVPGGNNRAIYEDYLSKMSNAEFEAFIVRLENQDEIISLWCPNMTEDKINMDRNFDVAEELGFSFMHRLRLTDQDTGQVSVTPIEHFVCHQMIRRQAQMLHKKKGFPDHNRSVDERSGQATNDSKGASTSYPELMINAAKGDLDPMLIEMIKYRGGDNNAFNKMNRQIMETGGASLDAIAADGPTNVGANDTLAVLLKSGMLDINL